MQNYNSRKRKSRKKIEPYLSRQNKVGVGTIIQIVVLGGFIVVLAVFLVASVSRGKQRNPGMGGATAMEAMENGDKQAKKDGIEFLSGGSGSAVSNGTQALLPERKLAVDNISITGLSREEAKEKLLDAYGWDMKLSYGESVESLKNPLPERLDLLLQDIFSEEKKAGDGQETENYSLDVSLLETDIREQVSAIASKWNRKPTNAQLTGRDKGKGAWIYSDGERGIQIDEQAAMAEIMDMARNKDFTGTIKVQARETAPELSAQTVKDQYKVIGSFSTTATSNSNRNNNIQLAMDALDGLVIFPGEEFSFNKTTGNRTKERGYLPAGAYRNGEFVEEPGGGVCQVSSTLYNAIIFSGIKTTERNPHSFEPSYVIPGEDAMVSYDGYSGPDLRFVNVQDTSVAIRAVFQDKKLTISIIGLPILEPGVEVSMRSQKTKEIEPPAPAYEEDQTLQPGQEVVVQEGVKGSTWKTWLVTKKDGVVVEEDYFHTSTYRGKPGVVKRNTTGVVVPAETEGGAGEGGQAPSGGGESPSGEAAPGTGETVPGTGNVPGIGNAPGTGETVPGAAGTGSGQSPEVPSGIQPVEPLPPELFSQPSQSPQKVQGGGPGV